MDHSEGGRSFPHRRGCRDSLLAQQAALFPAGLGPILTLGFRGRRWQIGCSRDQTGRVSNILASVSGAFNPPLLARLLPRAATVLLSMFGDQFPS
jgi:hypothetical protein